MRIGEINIEIGDKVYFKFEKGTHYAGLRGLCEIEDLQTANPKGNGVPIFRKGTKVVTFVQIKSDNTKGASFRCEIYDVIFAQEPI